MNKEEILKVVRTLVGPIRPVGESNTDSERLENLKTLCGVVDLLVMEIDAVGFDFKDYHEASIKGASEYARNFMKNTLGINS